MKGDSRVGTTNRLKQLTDDGKVAVGLSCSTGNVHAAEIFAQSEIDYLYFDQQHGLTSFDTLLGQLRVTTPTETTPLVRVLRNDPGLIGQVLDAGAHGVIVPMVNTAEEARQAVSGCRYQPVGVRSWGPLRATFGFGTEPDEVNREVLCLVMIETQGGLENLDAIANEPGIDGVYVGPHDLAVSMGLGPGSAQIQPGAHAEAIERICSAFRSIGKIAAISGNPGAMADLGFNLVTAGSDGSILQSGLRQVLDLRRELREAGY